MYKIVFAQLICVFRLHRYATEPPHQIGHVMGRYNRDRMMLSFGYPIWMC